VVFRFIGQPRFSSWIDYGKWKLIKYYKDVNKMPIEFERMLWKTFLFWCIFSSFFFVGKTLNFSYESESIVGWCFVLKNFLIESSCFFLILE
jgi:hypothetical protein